MNEIEIAIFFLMISFIGSLLFSNKKKDNNALSFFINLEIEYIFIGLIIFVIGKNFSTGEILSLKPYMALIMSFMGLLIGSQFSVKLLKTIQPKIFIVLIIIYITCQILIFLIFYLLKIKEPYLMAIVVNTAMPYSIQLFGRLFKVPYKQLFYTILISSLYPVLAIGHYAIYIGYKNFTLFNMFTGILIALVFALLVSTYAQINKKQGINTISVIMLIVLAGLSEYLKLSPLIIGFLSGLFLANFHYSDIFINIYSSFERFFYLFCYIFTGIFLFKDIPQNSNFYLSALLVTLVLILLRKKFLKYLFCKQMATKEKYLNIISIGILPAVIIMDYGVISELKNISSFLWMFLIIHILTEIAGYKFLYNEKKNS